MSEYKSCAETAKLIRAALKESFPGIKFGVRSSTYAGGASIRVSWSDGPNGAQVKAVAGAFQGGYFDGMTDYKGSRYHMLDGVRTHFAADFVFCERDYSDAAIQRALDHVMNKYRPEVATPTVADYRKGLLRSVGLFGEWDHHWNIETQASIFLNKRSDRLASAKSATLARLHYLGDDGYGYGSTGPAHLSAVK
jgi:hypothetical protein